MNTQQIEYVLTLAEEKSFSKAAAKLYVTQPSLSQYIMNIEKQAGVQLFDRSTSPIKLTAAGEIYVNTAEKIKTLEENMTNRLSDLEKLHSGTLRIGASTFRASCMLSKSITEFRKKYSGINLSITEGSREYLLEAVRRGELDLAVSSGSFDEKLFRYEELSKEKLFLAVPKENSINEKLTEYALTDKDIRTQSMKYIMTKPVDIEKLKDLSFVVLNNGNSGEFSTDKIFDEFRKHGIKHKTVLNVKTVETLFSFVNAGFGAAFIPDTLIKFGNFKVHPVYYSFKDNAENSVCLVSKRSGYFSNAAQEYSLLLKKLVDIGTWRV